MNKNQIIPLLVILLSFVLGLLFFPIQERVPAGISSSKSLQLKTISFETPTPKPILTQSTKPCLHHDDGKPNQDSNCYCNVNLIECQNQKCKQFNSAGHGWVPCTTFGFKAALDANCSANNPSTYGKDGFFCVGKPVIYLYPQSPMLVDVTIKTSGKIAVSEPLYPSAGWKNVLANPDGTLYYQNKKYTELFYESEISEYLRPTKGIIIPTSQLQPNLKKIIYQLGLNAAESEEFTNYWLPRLYSLNANYILFSIIEPNAKEKIDKVYINPEPKTRIEFIANFSPLSIPVSIDPLVLPPRPARYGFTSVEWGGLIDSTGELLLQ